MEEIKKTRNKKKKYLKCYSISFSDEELKKIQYFKDKSGWAISKIIREHLLIGGLLEDDEDLIKKISMLKKSDEWIYKNQISFSYTEKMEEKLKDIEEKTGAYKTSLIRTFLQNSKLI
jgi:predicted DNA-binding protein